MAVQAPGLATSHNKTATVDSGGAATRARSMGNLEDPDTTDEMLLAVRRLQKATGEMEHLYPDVKKEMLEWNHG